MGASPPGLEDPGYSFSTLPSPSCREPSMVATPLQSCVTKDDNDTLGGSAATP